MSAFRVGQQCRMVNCETAVNPDFRQCSGDEVVILGLPGACVEYPESYEITRPQHYIGQALQFYAKGFRLTPLTDPLAEQFIARLEKLGREPVIQTEKVTK